jgi:hypothetical protein
MFEVSGPEERPDFVIKMLDNFCNIERDRALYQCPRNETFEVVQRFIPGNESRGANDENNYAKPMSEEQREFSCKK